MNSLPVELSELETAARRIRLIGRLLSRVGQNGSDPGSPTRSEQGILALLEEHGPLTAKRLAELEALRPQSVAQTLDALEKSKWVRRERSAVDRREVLNTINEAGSLALEHGRRHRQQWLVRAFQEMLDPDEQVRLVSALELLEKVAKAEVDD